jgi:hypothetical protein
VRGFDAQQIPGVLNRVIIAKVVFRRHRQSCECVHGKGAEPLTFDQDPVVIAGREESAPVVPDRRGRIASTQRIHEGDHIDPDRRRRVPPDGVGSDVQKVVGLR